MSSSAGSSSIVHTTLRVLGNALLWSFLCFSLLFRLAPVLDVGQRAFFSTPEHFREALRRPFFMTDAIKTYSYCALATSKDKGALLNPDMQATYTSRVTGMPTKFDAPLRTGNIYVPDDRLFLTPSEYLPPYILLMLPCLWMSLQSFCGIMAFCNIAALLFVIVPFAAQRNRIQGWALLGWTAVALSMPEVWINFMLGQNALILAALLVGFFVATERNKDALGALALVMIGVLKPQFALLPLVVLAARKRYKAIGWCAAFGLVALAASCIAFGPELVISFPSKFAQIYHDAYVGTPKFFSPLHALPGLLGLCWGMFGRKFAYTVASLPLTVLSLAVSYMIWRQANKAGNQAEGMAIAASICVVLLMSPKVDNYDMVFLLVAWAATVPVQRITVLAKENKLQALWCLSFWLYPTVVFVCGFVDVYYIKHTSYYYLSYLIPILSAITGLSLLLFRDTLKRVKANQEPATA